MSASLPERGGRGRRTTGVLPRLPTHCLLLSALLFVNVDAVAGQADSEAVWNQERVLRLLDRARELRSSALVDPEFSSYRAEARGYVYFFVERQDSASQILVKADQVALDLYWRAPSEARQRIVGRRDERLLPTRVRYHLDHLTVVQDDFGDFIRLGDGDEVEAVVHPVSALGSDFYDFQLADSLTLSYAGGAQVVRVYEVRVRPRDFGGPGFVGTVYLDRDRAAIVRMNFSFTPSSYVDVSLDYIRISLDNSLWLGARWLPYRQEVEIRREVPALDFMSGSVIRNVFEVRGYEFNVPMPDEMEGGPKISAVSVSQRQAFPFERGLFDDLAENGGLAPSPTMDEVQAQVREVVEDHVMSGLSPIRLYMGSVSDFARYNRAEGIFTGAGLTIRPRGDVVMRGTAGYSFGRKSASGALRVTSEASGLSPRLEVYWDAMGDIGGYPGSTPLENTISSASGSKDYLDPYFRRGGTLTLARRPAGPVSVSLSVEQHVAARDVVSDSPETDFRPVRSITEGTAGTLAVTTRFGLPASGTATMVAKGGRVGSRTMTSLAADVTWSLDRPGASWTAEATASGAVVNAGAPPQSMYLLGGRYTLPGHAYRSFAGNAYWLVRAEGTVPVWAPWLGVRAFTAIGSTYLPSETTLPADWLNRRSSGLRGSVGLGLSIGWDSMRLDVGRAVWGSGWEAVVSTSPKFRGWL
jgi:hypothetical protein